MGDLPQARIAKNPLVILALSLITGILFFRYFNNSNSAFVLIIALLLLSIAALSFLRRTQSIIIAFLLVAFITAGYVLALVEKRSVSPNRIVRMFERGVLVPNEPVELTGTIQ